MGVRPIPLWHAPQVFDLVVHGTCGAGNFLRNLTPQGTSGQITVNLSDLKFCEPFGLVSIAAVAQDAILKGTRVHVVPPSIPKVARYLSRMHLGRTLREMGVDHDLPDDINEQDIDTLIELHTFEGAVGVTRLAEHLFQAVKPASPETAGALHTGISEAGGNVIEHSGAVVGFAAAQRTHHQKTLLFAVSDPGVGLLETLRSQGADSDSRALQLALTEGVTRTSDRHRGLGLSSLANHAGQLKGHLHLMSGNASMRASETWRSQPSVSGGVTFPGTAIQGWLEIAK